MKVPRGFVAGCVGTLLSLMLGGILSFFYQIAFAATGELVVTYVPRDIAAEDKYVPVDLVIPGPRAPKQVQQHIAALQEELAPHLIPMPVGYNREILGKCEVEVLQDPVSKKSKNPEPYYRINCWSIPLWKEDKGLRPAVSVPKTPIEAAVILRHFSRLHFARVGESVTRQVVRHRALGT